MKKSEGLSLITLIITIVVMIMLAGIAVYEGLSTNRYKAAKTKTVYEVVNILDAVTNRGLLNRINPSFYPFVGSNNFTSIAVGTSSEQQTYNGNGDWYIVREPDEFKELGLENVEGEYVVNYMTGEVVSTEAIKYEDEVYFSLNALKRKMGGGSILLSNAEYDAQKGVNKPVLSNGMVPVKLSGGTWVVANTDDEAWYDYSKDQMAWANVMLKDELTVEDSSGKVYSNDEVRNMSISDLAGKKVKSEGSSYVWIPRYTATSLGETESEIIFSNLTNDTTSANGNTYLLPQAFTYTEGGETIDLPGIWVSKYEASFDR